uniref:Uncharacterized protein n=1 Tax=Candidatus Methanophaga sp. ANME-1 ERB7 TaxID=2759913 RepID=A0A7G9ZCZ2_9EURY|nr:hypothetical protein HJJEBIEG_00028 [Methanosarcinales archaeon ANME-1 ERB7]
MSIIDFSLFLNLQAIKTYQNLIYIIIRESGILDMLDMDEIDPRVLVELDKNKRD